MNDFEKISHLIRFGLTFNKLSVAAIIEWSDAKINEQTEHQIFFELSLAKSSNQIIEILSERITWNFNNAEVRNLILSYYKEYLHVHSEAWYANERELVAYFQLLEYDNSNERVQDFLYFLVDDCQLRNEGFEGLLSMPNYMIENLAEFEAYQELQELLRKEGLNGYEV